MPMARPAEAAAIASGQENALGALFMDQRRKSSAVECGFFSGFVIRHSSFQLRRGPFQLALKVLALVEPKPAAHADSLARRAIRQQGIGVQAGHQGMTPRAPASLPGRQYPAITAG